MTSNFYPQYIAGYTFANFGRYPIRRRVTKAYALEYYLEYEPKFILLNQKEESISRYRI